MTFAPCPVIDKVVGFNLCLYPRSLYVLKCLKMTARGDIYKTLLSLSFMLPFLADHLNQVEFVFCTL